MANRSVLPKITLKKGGYFEQGQEDTNIHFGLRLFGFYYVVLMIFVLTHRVLMEFLNVVF